MKKIIVLGSLNMDLVISSSYLPKAGETITGNGFRTNPGGKGANQAITCAKLGEETYLIGAVGDDLYGRDLLKNLKNNNVNVDYVSIENNISTGVAVILLTENDNRIILDPSANYKVKKSLIDKCFDEHVVKGDIFISQLEIPMDKVVYGLKKAKEKSLYTILNPAPATKLNDEIYKYVDLIILNETESKTITNIYPKDDKSILDINKFFVDRNIENVIITLGSKGAVTIVNNEVKYINSIKVNAVDTTAAGDSFVGSIAVELGKGSDLLSAIKKSNIIAGITVTKEGAQNSIPTKKEYEEFIKYLKGDN